MQPSHDVTQPRPPGLCGQPFWRRRVVHVGLAVLIVIALVVGLVVASVSNRQVPDPTTEQALPGATSSLPFTEPPTARARFSVDLGSLSSRVATVQVAGSVYPLGTDAGADSTDVFLSDDAGGVAMVLDKDRNLLATAPVWAYTGEPPPDITATCTSTAFGQLLMTPGLAASNALVVDLLWAAAQQVSTADLLGELGKRVCAGLQDDPTHLAHPDAAESQLRAQALAALFADLDQIAGQLPPLETSLNGLVRPASFRSAPTPGGGATGLEDGGARSSVGAITAAGSPTANGGASALRRSSLLAQVASDGACNPIPALPQPNGGSAPVALCGTEEGISVTNTSAAWAFLFAARSPLGIPHISGFAVGQTAIFPSLESILGAMLHDFASGVAWVGCKLLSLFSKCKKSKPLPPVNAMAGLFDLLKPGSGTVQESNGYFSVQWGSGEGNTESLPTEQPQAEKDRLIAYSRTAAGVTSLVLPVVGLILAKQLDPHMEPNQLALIIPVLNELVGEGIVGSGEASVVTDFSTFISTLAKNPQLLGAVIGAFLPSVFVVSKDVLADLVEKKLEEYALVLAVPGAGWAAALAEALVEQGPELVTVLLSFKYLWDAQSKPTYTSWARELTPTDAFDLPATAFSTTAGVMDCPAPPAHMWAPPNAPGVLDCLWVTDLDLDGNGAQDKLLTWRSQATRGATAILDSGTVLSLSNADTARENTIVPWSRTNALEQDQSNGGLVSNAAAPAGIFGLQSPRQAAEISMDEGAHANSVGFIGLDDTGALRLLEGTSGGVLDLPTAADFGCAQGSHHRMFVLTATGQSGEESLSPDGSFADRNLFDINSELRLENASHLGQTPSMPTLTDLTNTCGPAAPTASPPPAPATSGEQAVTTLTAAALHGDAAAGSPVISGVTSNAASPDVFQDPWYYLTLLSTPLQLLAASVPVCTPVTDAISDCRVPVQTSTVTAVTFRVIKNVYGAWEVDWAQVESSVPPTDLTGEVYGLINSVDVSKGQISFDKVDWFTGADAVKACAEDGVTGSGDNRCTTWYFRKTNPELRTVAVSPSAAISVIFYSRAGVQEQSSDLAGLRDKTLGVGAGPFVLQVDNGQVTSIKEVFLP